MNRTKIYESLSDYVDGNMTNEQLKDFEKKIVQDKLLKKEVDDIRSLIKDIKSADTIELDSDFDYRLKQAIKVETGKASYIHKIFNIFDRPAIAAVGSVAAALVLVIMTTVFFSDQSSSSPDLESGKGFLEDQTIGDNDEEYDNNEDGFDTYDTQQVGNEGASN